MDDVGIDKVIESNKVSFKKVIKTSLAIKFPQESVCKKF